MSDKAKITRQRSLQSLSASEVADKTPKTSPTKRIIVGLLLVLFTAAVIYGNHFGNSYAKWENNGIQAERQWLAHLEGERHLAKWKAEQSVLACDQSPKCAAQQQREATEHTKEVAEQQCDEQHHYEQSYQCWAENH